MKRIVLLLLMLYCLRASLVEAGCEMAEEAPMWIDIDRYVAFNNTYNLTGPEAGIKAIYKDVENGFAYWIKKGTPVKVLHKLPNGNCIFEIKGIEMFGHYSFLKCN